MRKGAPWLNLTLLCDLCGISASGRGGVGKGKEREKRGIGWIKGPCMQKKSSRRDGDRQGHTEQGGPDREGEWECSCYYSIYLPCHLFIEGHSVLFCLILPVSSFFFNLYLVSLQPLVTEMQTNCDANALLLLIFQLSLSSLSAIVPRSDFKPDCSLQTSLPSSYSYWVCHAGWPFLPCQSSLSSESGAAYCWNKEVERRLLRKGSAICPDPNSPPTEN